LTEDLVSLIDSGFESSALPEKYKVTIGAVTALINDPRAGLSDDLRAALLEHFTPAQLVELLVTAAFASGMSKATIAWGPPPEMQRTEVPTPTPDPNQRYAQS
jgi:alkylhydroperoxidase family enzyme